MCNPGGAAALLGIEQQMEQLYCGVTLGDFERRVGHELGVVRISFGLASNYWDVFSIVRFVDRLASERTRSELWEQWITAQGLAQRSS